MIWFIVVCTAEWGEARWETKKKDTENRIPNDYITQTLHDVEVDEANGSEFRLWVSLLSRFSKEFYHLANIFLLSFYYAFSWNRNSFYRFLVTRKLKMWNENEEGKFNDCKSKVSMKNYKMFFQNLCLEFFQKINLSCSTESQIYLNTLIVTLQFFFFIGDNKQFSGY